MTCPKGHEQAGGFRFGVLEVLVLCSRCSGMRGLRVDVAMSMTCVLIMELEMTDDSFHGCVRCNAMPRSLPGIETYPHRFRLYL